MPLTENEHPLETKVRASGLRPRLILAVAVATALVGSSGIAAAYFSNTTGTENAGFTAATLTEPVNVTAEHEGTGLTTNSGGVTVNWAANNFHTGYSVSRAPLSGGTCGSFSAAGTSTTTSFSDTTAVYNSSYCYHVGASYNNWTGPNSSPDNVALSLAPSSISDTTSGGTISWIQQTSPTTQALNSVSAVDTGHVWAVGVNSGNTDTVVFYDGTSWSNQSFGVTTGKSLNSVSALDSAHVWAVGANLDGTHDNVVFYNGSSWAQQSFAVTTGKNLNGAFALDSTHVWAVGDNLDGTHDNVALFNGATWTDQSISVSSGQKLFGVWAADSSHVWAVGNAGQVGFFNGASWSFSQPAGIGNVNLTAVTGSDSNHVWASAATGAVYFWNGSTWAAQASAGTADTNHQLNDVVAVDGSDAWAVGSHISATAGNVIFYNGASWSLQTLTTTSNTDLSGVAAADVNHVWAVGAGGVIYFRGLAGGAGVAKASDSSTYTTVANWPNQSLSTTSCPANAVIMAVGVSIPAGAAIDNVQATLFSEASASPGGAAREQVLVSGDGGTSWAGPTVSQAPAGTSFTEQTFDLSPSWNGLSSPNASQMKLCLAATTGGGTTFNTTFDLVHVDADFQADVTASPTAGGPGTTVTVSGSGFVHNSPVTVSLIDSSGTTFASLASSTTDSSGNLPGGLSFAVPATPSVGAGEVLVTDGTGLVGSTTFTVSPYASRLVFTNQVSNGSSWGVAGSPMAPQPMVAAEDSIGDIITSYSTPISLTFSGTGSFFCTNTTVTPVNGVATFSNCKVSAVGTTDTLTAASGSLPNAISNTYSISSAPTIAGVTFTNANHTGTTCSPNTFPNAVCTNGGNGGTGTFSFDVVLASGGTPLAPISTTTSGPVLVTAAYATTSGKGSNFTTGPTSAVVAAGNSATTVPFSVTGLGAGWGATITVTVVIGSNSYTLTLAAN